MSTTTRYAVVRFNQITNRHHVDAQNLTQRQAWTMADRKAKRIDDNRYDVVPMAQVRDLVR